MTDRARPSRRDFMRVSGLAAGSLAAFAACTTQTPPEAAPTRSPDSPTPAGTATSPTVDVDSWAPQPVTMGDFEVTSMQRGEELVLRTVDGERTFWAGVGLTATLPGHLPGEFAPTAEDYRRWFGMMRDVGVRVVRLDSLQAPALYTELLAHNKANPDAPLYLLQGITVPALNSPGTDDRPFGTATRTAMTAEIAATSAAIHGDLQLPSSGSAPNGRWSADVSPWIAGWIIGSPWIPGVALATDRDYDARPYKGTYFTSSAEASATESWIAARMDELATAEAKRGVSAPIAAANHPATDPLEHPEEPVKGNDLVSIDVNHIGVLTTWPGGTFAAYAAYPFTPKFLRYQNSYRNVADPYRAYLLDLRGHHQGLPLVVTEFGVPASLGRSDNAALGRNSGFLDEQSAMRTNADLLVMFREIGVSGGLLRSWTDDWSATSPPTEPRTREVRPERRALFHDPLTSTQWYGLLAHDPAKAGARVVHNAPEDEMTKVTVDHDASYLYMTLFFTRRVTSPVDVGFKLFEAAGLRLPGGSGRPVYDVALHFVPTMSTVTMFVRRTLDPARLDGLPTLYLPRANSRGWVVHQLTMAPPLEVPGRRTMPAEMLRVGELVLGTWDTSSSAYNSLATWQLVRPDPAQPMEWRLRLPWSMLAFADPAGRKGLVPDLGEPTLVDVTSMDVMVESSTPGSPAYFRVAFPGWSELPATTERLRAGMTSLSEAFVEATRPLDA